jgi:heme ABC exporter ATP-binding subunit CcmA
MDDVIHLRSAVALVGRFPVLAGVDLDVSPTEIVLLQGANGAGKTSILRACAGLLRVVAGEATVLGVDLVADPRPVRRRIGYFGHATALYDDLSVEENVRFALRAAGVDPARTARALERVGLVGRLPGVRVASLSAGQRRRTALAALVARDPELWLLDEPHAGLDAEHRDALDELVRDAVGRGRTVVLASHERDRAHALAGRIVTVAGGTVLAAAAGDGDTGAHLARSAAGPASGVTPLPVATGGGAPQPDSGPGRPDAPVLPGEVTHVA